MAETVTMPKLGFDMAEGTLVRWVKVEGDTVNKGDVLAEIETDKATVEVESSFGGVVAKELVHQGDIVPVGTAIAIIAQPGEKVEASAPGEAAPAAATGEKPAETTPAAAAGPTPAATAAPAVAEPATEGDGRIKASPLARKIATEKGINLSQVKGTGTGGRIQRSDVEAALQTGMQPAAAPAVSSPAVAAHAQPAVAAHAAPAVAAHVEPAVAAHAVPLAPISSGVIQAPQDEGIKINRLRAAIGRRMVESKQQVPHFYVTRAFKMEMVMALRKQLNGYLPDDQKLTVNDFIVKAVGLALRQFPNLNAALKGDEIVRYGHVNVGVAVSVEGGLLTITVKDADQKPLRQISSEVREMAGRARMGKVRPEDIEGSTFSISNLGMYDVDEFIAIISPPEAAILAVGSAKQVPVVEDGQVKPGLRMNATISADHRVTDGAEAARFMQALAAYLEDPMRLML